MRDSRQGMLTFKEWSEKQPDKAFGTRVGATTPMPITASICPGRDPGDQTVPARSADHQLGHANVKAVFRQTGYEHQGSYKDEAVIAATLYSIVRIALRVEWKCAP